MLHLERVGTLPKGRPRAVVLAAHSDDQAIGCGGMLLSLKRKGYATSVLILSRGELSHPWLREEVITAKRRAESIRAMRILKVDQTIFFPLSERELARGLDNPHLLDTLRVLLEELRPDIIITHNDEDSHTIHRVVHTLTLRASEDLTARILAYDIWTIAHRRRLRDVWLYVDITPYAREKWRAIRVFHSQTIAVATQYIPIHIRHYVNGFLAGYGLAERFAIIRDHPVG